ncbi:hypothetical protein [Mesonia aestuariivivens]|uniref:Lipocalin-like domain-containing protein n=1 Tax=Mesonia aestuariivivens TaxID=2796128 RepID=A0ABS6W537_9FLAO|nr:hypothetical protein [Mesonia aestuariivivens]MBW2962824.1 hypothetical protein [Mesonia aestuariivivens]
MKIYIFFSLIGLLYACQEDDDNNVIIKTNTCGESIIIDAENYNNAESDAVTITDITIDNDCLIVSFSSSGCDGNTWITQLIDSEAILESNPPQRKLRIILNNNEACLAVITKQKVFDLTELQIAESNSIFLKFDSLDEEFLYEY